MAGPYAENSSFTVDEYSKTPEFAILKRVPYLASQKQKVDKPRLCFSTSLSLVTGFNFCRATNTFARAYGSCFFKPTLLLPQTILLCKSIFTSAPRILN